jgi:hypothetical protein
LGLLSGSFSEANTAAITHLFATRQFAAATRVGAGHSNFDSQSVNSRQK